MLLKEVCHGAIGKNEIYSYLYNVMKTTYKQIDNDNFYVFVETDEYAKHDINTPIGLVTRGYSKPIKWTITAYFICMHEDTIKINDSYYDAVHAGRALTDVWKNIQIYTKNKKLGPDDTWPDNWSDLFKNIP